MTAPADLVAWVARRRRAAARELDEQRRYRPSPAESFDHALSLIAFAAARHGWPLAQSDDDELAFHQVWSRLRRRLGAS